MEFLKVWDDHHEHQFIYAIVKKRHWYLGCLWDGCWQYYLCENLPKKAFMPIARGDKFVHKFGRIVKNRGNDPLQIFSLRKVFEVTKRNADLFSHPVNHGSGVGLVTYIPFKE